MKDIGGLQAYLDGLPALERQLRHIGFTCLLRGDICNGTHLTEQLCLNQDALQELIATMESRGTLQWDHTRDRLIATGGLSLHATPHQLALPNRKMYAWCAADAVGIPAAVGLDAIISSTCHQCGVPITIEMKAGQVHHAEPSTANMWVSAGDPSQSVSGHT
jgi:hypothetical protein